MTKVNNIRDFYKILDSILKLLSDSNKYVLYKSIIKDSIKSKNLEFVGRGNTFIDEIFNEQHNEEKFDSFFDEAIRYLADNKFIEDDGISLKLTFNGIIQSSVGFVNTLDLKETSSQRLYDVEKVQKFHLTWMTILTALIAAGTFVSMIYYLLEIFSTNYCFCKGKQ